MQTRFLLHPAGWADLILTQGTERIEIPISYLTDAPRDLLMAIRALLRGARESRVVFQDEPGESVLVLKRLSGELLQLKVYRGDDWGAVVPERDEPAFRHKLPLAHFAAQVLGEFDRLLRELGPAGYRELWTLYDFPAEAHNDVRALLGQAV